MNRHCINEENQMTSKELHITERLHFLHTRLTKNLCDSFDHWQGVEQQKQSPTTGKNVKLVWKKRHTRVFSAILPPGIHSDNCT